MLKNEITLKTMILFSPAKINIGLQVIERRADGYHNLRSVMVPVPLFDMIEIVQAPATSRGIEISLSGTGFDTGEGGNLCARAYERLAAETFLPPVRLHLHKQIPVGAGLGGGSSNASLTLRGLNRLAKPPLTADRLLGISSSLGSDCPFFMHSGMMMLEGRGEILSPVSLNLDHLVLVLLYPGIHVSTAEAFAGIRPAIPAENLSDLILLPVDEWKGRVVNDFENHIFKRYPLLAEIRDALYSRGALYASMSGSGSSIYGFFPSPPHLPDELSEFVVFRGSARMPSHSPGAPGL
ncbi:MAG: 4-(cytidine 5'-diphospho)-2-C-methyl-D-erythritol kinase [Bacteroidetes bacterium]|nr:MAG: 4-(cytidine 5'-diphospho)-2-C-methyl-D-erythritol kinase [Bacteroidota bacterium]